MDAERKAGAMVRVTRYLSPHQKLGDISEVNEFWTGENVDKRKTSRASEKDPLERDCSASGSAQYSQQSQGQFRRTCRGGTPKCGDRCRGRVGRLERRQRDWHTAHFRRMTAHIVYWQARGGKWRGCRVRLDWQGQKGTNFRMRSNWPYYNVCEARTMIRVRWDGTVVAMLAKHREDRTIGV